MADKLYSVDLGELGIVTGTKEQLDNMMMVFNKASIFCNDKKNASEDERLKKVYYDYWDTYIHAQCSIWDEIRNEFVKEVVG